MLHVMNIFCEISAYKGYMPLAFCRFRAILC